MFDFLSALFGNAATATNRLAQPIAGQPVGQPISGQAAPPLPPPTTINSPPKVAGVQPDAAPAPIPGSLSPMMAQPSQAPAAQPQRSFADRYKDFTSSDRGQALNDFFTGMAMGKTPQESLSMGAALVSQNRGARRDKNQTIDWLKRKGLDEDTARQLAASPKSLQEYLTNMLTPQGDEYIGAGGSIFNKRTKEWLTPPTGAARQTEYGLNLIYGKDPATGKTVGYQLSKDGSYKPFEPPGGVELTPGVSTIDTGTGTTLINNKTGATVGQVEKDVAGAANQSATGKNMADAANALPAIETSANSALGTIDSLLNDPYLPNMVGPSNAKKWNITADSQRVQSKMDQLNGQAFLQAFNTLRGGGAITETEGQKGTEAIARLNKAQNEKDYRDALSELRGVIQAGVANARKRAGISAPTSENDPFGIR